MTIHLDNIIKMYNNKKVLDIKKLVFMENIIYGIVGENGAGKTTLLRLLAGLEKSENGKIKYLKNDLNSFINNKEITLVSQKPYLLNTSVYNNLVFGMKIRKISKENISIKINEIINILSLEKLIKKNAKVLSEGEVQRVALARAILLEPKILLLDEPTSSLDSNYTFIFEQIIKNYNNNNKIIIIVAHDLELINRLCDEVILLEDGKIKNNLNIPVKYHSKSEKIIEPALI